MVKFISMTLLKISCFASILEQILLQPFRQLYLQFPYRLGAELQDASLNCRGSKVKLKTSDQKLL